MPTNYVVKSGDCISSIAFEFGFFPDTIWNHPSNAELKNNRKDPNTLCAGDTVVVPDKREKVVSKPTAQVHKFRLSNTPAVCSLQLFDQDEYRANESYELEVDGVKRIGKTNAEGVLRVSIPPNARVGKLTMGEGENKTEFDLRFGYIEPPTETRGVQARLKNLGFYCRINGRMDDDTRQALLEFQAASGLQETGEIDQATQQKLDELHDNVCDIPNRDEVKQKDDSQSQPEEIETPFEEEQSENEEDEPSENEIKDQSEKSEDNELEDEMKALEEEVKQKQNAQSSNEEAKNPVEERQPENKVKNPSEESKDNELEKESENDESEEEVKQ